MINSLFRGNLAETGLGRPVTSKIRRLEKKDYPLAIYDTPGFELSAGQQNKVKDEVIDIIRSEKDFCRGEHEYKVVYIIIKNRSNQESDRNHAVGFFICIIIFS